MIRSDESTKVLECVGYRFLDSSKLSDHHFVLHSAKGSIVERLDVSRLKISKIGVKVFAATPRSIDQQVYFGMKVYDRLTQKWYHVDARKESTDRRQLRARWEIQEIPYGQRLVGWYFKKCEKGIIRQLGIQTAKLNEERNAFVRDC